MIQSGGNIGIGSSSPVAILDVNGKAGTNNTKGGNALAALPFWAATATSVLAAAIVPFPITAVATATARSVRTAPVISGSQLVRMIFWQ